MQKLPKGEILEVSERGWGIYIFIMFALAVIIGMIVGGIFVSYVDNQEAQAQSTSYKDNGEGMLIINYQNLTELETTLFQWANRYPERFQNIISHSDGYSGFVGHFILFYKVK